MAKSNIGYIITAEFKGGVRYPDWTKENWRCDSIAGFKDICKRDGYECRNTTVYTVDEFIQKLKEAKATLGEENVDLSAFKIHTEVSDIANESELSK